VALQRAQVIFCLDRGGVVGSDGATHNGIFDIAYLRCLPNFVLMSPRDTGELAQMMELAGTCDGPTAIRFPRGSGAKPEAQLTHAPFGVGAAERVADGDDGCIVAYGPMVYAALELRRRIRAASGGVLAVVNARFAKPLDEHLLAAELARQPIVFTLEDHVLAGGFGSGVLELARARGLDANRLEVLALPDRFVDHGQRGEQLAACGLDLDRLTERIGTRLAALAAATPVRLVRATHDHTR
jgi:1-deoxy-D-xylulose-5-phosphate synthase